MPVQTQQITLGFQGGPNEQSDPRLLQPGQQASALNVDWSKEGAVKKRFGSTALGKATIGTFHGNLSNVGYMCGYQGSLCMIDGGSGIFSVQTTKGIVAYDRASICVGRSNTTTSVGLQPDIAVASDGTQVYAYVAFDVGTNANVYVDIIDPNGATIARGIQINSASAVMNVRVVCCGSIAVIIYRDSGTATIAYATISLTTLAVTTGTGWLFDGLIDATHRYLDVCPVAGSSTDFCIAYFDTTKNVRVSRYSVNGSSLPTLVTTANFVCGGTAPNSVQGLSVICTVGETCWISYAYFQSTDTNVYIKGLNHAAFGTVTTAETTICTFSGSRADLRISLIRINSGLCGFACSPVQSQSADSGLIPNDIINRTITTSGTVVGTGNQPYHHISILGKMFTLGTLGDVYAMCAIYGTKPSVTTRPTLVLAKIFEFGVPRQTVRIAATLVPRLLGFDIGALFDTASYVAAGIGGNCVSCPQTNANGVWTSLTNSIKSSQQTSGITRVDFDFTPSAARFWSAELGNGLYLGGGVPSLYDGTQVAEMGFVTAPGYAFAAQSAGGAMADATYNYAFLYSWVDGTGQVQRSTPTFTSFAVSGGSGTAKITFTVPTIATTNKQNTERGFRPPIQVEVYRTTPTQAITTVYYKVTPFTGASSSPQLPTLSVVDGTSDAALSGSSNFLYTTGGVLDGQIPPSLAPFIVHGKRLVGAGDDGTTLWFSTEYDGGTTQPRFNDALTLAVPDGGRITGLASMDGNLIIFKRNTILVLGGQGPNETGLGSDWGVPQRIATDVGCTQPRSVVVTPVGVFFSYSGKIYLLTRGLESVYVGHEMEDSISSNPVVTSAVLCPKTKEVRFSCAPSDASANGIVVVYNYVAKKWSRWQFYDVDQSVASCQVSAACVANDTYYWGTQFGASYQENNNPAAANAYLDGGTQWITLQLETAWLKMSGLASYGKFRKIDVLGQQLDPFNLTIEVANNYGPTYAESVSFSAAEMLAFTTPLRMASKHLVNQKVPAIRVRITDAPPSGGPTATTGQGAQFVGISVTAGVYPDNYRINPSQSK